mgnify:FL=1
MLLLVAATSHAAIQASFYVDPVNGNDANSGASTGTAFATLSRARAAVDAINGSMTGDIVVLLMPGDHVVTSTINLTENDAGTNGHEVIWTSYGPRGSARIIGGVKLPLPGQSWTLDSGSIYKTPLPAGSHRLQAIFENGVRGRLARHPNADYPTVDGPRAGYWSIAAKDSSQPKKRFQWASGNTLPNVSNPTELQVHVWPGNHDWSTEIHNVSAINYGTRWITLANNLQLAYLGDLASGSRYFVQGAKELLNQAGEFYHDAAAGMLYYHPRNTPISSQEIIAPLVTTIFSGTPTFGVQQLRAQWLFEDDTSDATGNNNDGASVNNPVFVASASGLGQAIALDGATQYVSVAHDATLAFGASTAPFSITAWIKTNGSGLQPIICKARPAGGAINMDYRLQLDANGKLQLWRWNVGNSTAMSVTDADGASLNDGDWHHVAFVNEGVGAHKLYVDGALVESSTATWSYGAGNNQPVEIGRFRDAHNNNTAYFDGAIDDARIYQSALSAAEVSALHQKLAPSDGPLENITFSNLKFVATNFDSANPTGAAQGMLFFRNASHITIENNEFSGGSAGVRISGPSSNLQIAGNTLSDMALAGIFCDGISDSIITNNRIRNTALVFADPGANIRIDGSTNSTISHNNLGTSRRHGIRMRTSTHVTIAYNEVTDANTDSQDTGAIYWGYADDNTVDHNRVHHSGNSFGQQHAFYVEDGSDRTTITNNIAYMIGNAPSNTLTAPINLKGVGNLVQNNIFDFTRSNSGLRTFEILANAPANNNRVLNNIFYSQGPTTIFYRFQSWSNNRLSQSNYNTFYKTASGSNVFKNIPGTDTLSNWKTILNKKYDQNSVTANPGFTDPTNHDYTFLSGPPTGFTAIDTSQIGLLPEFIFPSTAAQWVFSGNTSDITQHGHNGTNNGATFVANRHGAANTALSFDGANDFVAVADDPALDFGDPANPFTIVAWVKTSANTAGGIVAKARDSGTVNMDYRLQFLASGFVQLSRWNQAAGVTESMVSTSAINDGQWHHIAFVNEGAASHKLYIDGKLAGHSTALWLHDNTNNQPVRIGRDRNAGTADAYFSGVIDDVAIIQRALTLEELQDLNHLPHP